MVVPSLIIMGAGRSGTSLATGTLAQGPWYMGDDYIEPRSSNPKGFFEDSRVNAINEEILAQFLLYRLNLTDLRRNQRWLARLPAFYTPKSTPAIMRAIADLTSHKPFCYKDPRFSFTLPVWRAVAPTTKFIVVFRHPAETAVSTVKECESADYLAGVRMTYGRALGVWLAHYKAILRHYARGGDWLFIRYNDMFTSRGLDRLEAFTGIEVDRRAPDPDLRRSRSHPGIPARHTSVYDRLCKLALR